MYRLLLSWALIGCVFAQQPVVNITWNQMDGVTELPNGDVILAQTAEQTGTFCVGNLEVGIRIILVEGVEQWKAVELDADDPEGSNRFVVQHIGQEEPVTGIFPSRFISEHLLVLWKGEAADGILPPYRDEFYPAYMITDSKEMLEGGEIYDIIWMMEGSSSW